MNRDMAVAGQFYPFSPEDTKQLLDSCFARGCGAPGKNKDDSLVSLVCPHAGHIYSGWVAAYSFKELVEHSKAKTFVIVSPNHTGLGEMLSVYPGGEWETPLGNVPVNEKLAKAIAKENDFAKLDTQAHKFEHSIEVQLPFLQYVLEGSKFDIVPITTMLQDLETAVSLAKTIYGHRKDILLIASSDFTHHEPYAKAMAKDLDAIKSINALDSQGFISKIKENKLSICGYGPILTAMEYAKLCGAKKGELLKYATSGEVSSDRRRVVGYGAISFRR